MGLWRVPISLYGYKTGVCMKDKQKIVVYKAKKAKNRSIFSTLDALAMIQRIYLGLS